MRICFPFSKQNLLSSFSTTSFAKTGTDVQQLNAAPIVSVMMMNIVAFVLMCLHGTKGHHHSSIKFDYTWDYTSHRDISWPIPLSRVIAPGIYYHFIFLLAT